MAGRKTPLRVDPRFQTRDDLPSWLRTKLEAHIAMWESGRADTCLHSPTPTNGIPAHMAAWRSNLVTCPGCTHLATLRRGDPRIGQCDGCGQHTGDIKGGRVCLAGLSYAFEVCMTCRGEVKLAPQ
jgi:hypothetical protein